MAKKKATKKKAPAKKTGKKKAAKKIAKPTKSEVASTKPLEVVPALKLKTELKSEPVTLNQAQIQTGRLLKLITKK